MTLGRRGVRQTSPCVTGLMEKGLCHLYCCPQCVTYIKLPHLSTKIWSSLVSGKLRVVNLMTCDPPKKCCHMLGDGHVLSHASSRCWSDSHFVVQNEILKNTGIIWKLVHVFMTLRGYIHLTVVFPWLKFYWNVSAAWWIVMKFGPNIHVPQRLNRNVFILQSRFNLFCIKLWILTKTLLC